MTFRKSRIAFLSLISILSLAATTKNSIADGVQCLRYLRDIAYNETMVKSSTDLKNSLRYAMCKSDFRSRSEAQKAGLGLGITLFEIPFKADGSLDQSSFEQWKSTHCEDLTTSFSSEQETTSLIRTVSPEAVKIYNSCVSDSGLFCAISSPSPELINVQLDWKPYRGAKYAFTTLRSSSVVNASSLEPSTPTGQLAPVKYVIPYGGVVFQLLRPDVRRPVSVTVNTDNGACPPLSIPAEGDFAAQVEFSGTIERSAIKPEERSIAVTNDTCGATRSEVVELCGDTPLSAVTVSNEGANCGFAPAQAVVSGNCAKISTQVVGCAYGVREVKGTCWTEGVNHTRPRRVCPTQVTYVPSCEQKATYTATVVLSGKAWETMPIKKQVTSKTIANGQFLFVYDGSEYAGPDYRNPRISYRAVVTYLGRDGRPTLRQVSSEEPVSTIDGTTISSAFNVDSKTLLIFVEAGQDPIDPQRVNSSLTIDHAPAARVDSSGVTSEPFDLDGYSQSIMNKIGTFETE